MKSLMDSCIEASLLDQNCDVMGVNSMGGEVSGLSLYVNFSFLLFEALVWFVRHVFEAGKRFNLLNLLKRLIGHMTPCVARDDLFPFSMCSSNSLGIQVWLLHLAC